MEQSKIRRRVNNQTRKVHLLRNTPSKIQVGDKVRMRKPHPCGGYEWEVIRIGADIGIRCLTCGRRVMLPRSKFEKRVTQIIVPTPHTAP